MERTFPGDTMEPENGEVQLPALDTCPTVGGKLVGVSASWFKIDITNGKVTIAYPRYYDWEPEEVIREYDIKDVTLSGWPVGT